MGKFAAYLNAALALAWLALFFTNDALFVSHEVDLSDHLRGDAFASFEDRRWSLPPVVAVGRCCWSLPLVVAAGFGYHYLFDRSFVNLGITEKLTFPILGAFF